MAGTMTVELKSLRFIGTHGLYDEEKKVGNEFEVDLSISFAAQEEPITELSETVNYVEVYQIVATEMAEPKHLLETSAMRICNKLQQVFAGITEATVAIKKLTPPITGFSGSVGVRYTHKF